MAMTPASPLAGEKQQQRKREKRDVHGWLLLDKPVGMTSTHAVSVVKRLYQARRAGHAGREHHHQAFSSWMAGGGVKGGYAYGATDEFGFAAVEKKVHVHDLHATVLHLLGLDHERLTFNYGGRDFRLTDVHGNVVTDILA